MDEERLSTGQTSDNGLLQILPKMRYTRHVVARISCAASRETSAIDPNKNG
jgi:hypothetical protein